MNGFIFDASISIFSEAGIKTPRVDPQLFVKGKGHTETESTVNAQKTQPISGWWIGQIPCDWHSEILILEKSGANFRTPIT